MILMTRHVLRISQFRNIFGLTWFIINHSMVIKSNTHRHNRHMQIDLLTSNGLIINSRYYVFNDTTCMVSISI